MTTPLNLNLYFHLRIHTDFCTNCHTHSHVQEQAPLRSFTGKLGAASRTGADIAPGCSSKEVAKQLMTCCAGREEHVTAQILNASDCIGISQDSRDDALLIRVRCVLWAWPKALRNQDVDGQTSTNRFRPELGPWVVERILGVEKLGADRSATATASITVGRLRSLVKGIPGGFERVQATARFFTADNASDEVKACQLMRDDLPQLQFHIPDGSHSIQLAIKNGCGGDPEIDKVRQIMLTNKKPFPSVSSLLRHSSRFRSVFKEEQQGSSLTVLSHLSWAPQRMSSQARALSRASLKLSDLLTALAREAEGSASSKSVQAARYNIRELASYKRLMIAGLLADLCVEHHKAIRQADTEACDPAMVAAYLTDFEKTVRVLFMEGQIMTLRHSYTSQVIRFFENPSVLFERQQAVLFVRPDPQDSAAIYEPLERVRAIVGSVMACLHAAVPKTGWHYAFSAFYLPSPLGTNRPGSMSCGRGG